MAAQKGIAIKVDTDRLVSAASDVEAKIGQMERVFSDMEQKIRASVYFWEGDGASAYMAAYQRKKDIIDVAFRRFRENVTDLREIAGVYERAERETTEAVAELPSDCIV